MHQMNDEHKTYIDITKKTLTNIKFKGQMEMMVTFRLDDVIIETTLTYKTPSDARWDYQRLLKILEESTGPKQLLTEGKAAVNSWIEFARDGIKGCL
jgi:hypothetical protein